MKKRIITKWRCHDSDLEAEKIREQNFSNLENAVQYMNFITNCSCSVYYLFVFLQPRKVLALRGKLAG
jgi:hypothetical protein